MILNAQIRTAVFNAALNHVNGEGLFTRDLVAEFEMTLSELIGSVPCPGRHDDPWVAAVGCRSCKAVV